MIFVTSLTLYNQFLFRFDPREKVNLVPVDEWEV